MASGFAGPDLSNNELAMAREGKLSQLKTLWYETVVKTAPPSLDDPNLLRYGSKASYYYVIAWTQNPKIYDSLWDANPPSMISGIDWPAVDRTIQSVLLNTVKGQTGQGYGTCVIQTVEGKYNGEPSLFKLIIVAISFVFSAQEYNLDSPFDVTALGYWVYWLRSTPPFRSPQGVSGPPDMDIVGQKYITVAELDQYNP